MAADELAHYLVEDHVRAGLIGSRSPRSRSRGHGSNFSWFASAYDTDDWIFRLTTMVQMVGVIVLALGLPDMFASIDEGDTVDNRVMVAGYVVMRVAMVFQWIRAARQDPGRRSACLTYATANSLAQVGWVAPLIAETSVGATFAFAALLTLVEFGGPWIAERRKGGTPWHPHHIVERYGLLVIIALGEGVVGTIASLTAVVARGSGLVGRCRARRARRHRADVRHVVDRLRRAVRPGARRRTASVVRWCTGTPRHRRGRRHRRRPARCRLLLECDRR